MSAGLGKYRLMLSVAVMCAYALISAFGLFKIKAAGELLSADAAIGFVFYALGFVLWIYILRRFPLSMAFPVAAGSLVVATQAFGVIVLKESISVTHVAGIAAIVAGIGLVFARA